VMNERLPAPKDGGSRACNLNWSQKYSELEHLALPTLLSALDLEVKRWTFAAVIRLGSSRQKVIDDELKAWQAPGCQIDGIWGVNSIPQRNVRPSENRGCKGSGLRCSRK
jgi:hypothetical protein